MRHIRTMLLAGAALWTHPALAADALKYGPPPAWVHPQPIPAAKPTEAPVSILLHDQQIALERGKVTVYNEVAFEIRNPQGLAAGNLSVVWQPATDTITINKLQIRRGDKIIDVLANGQKFTALRRETNLDAATLDGTLTGNIQPEDLQEGDIVDFATTTQRSDPVFKGHVESVFGGWNGTPIESAHAELSWPDSIHLNIRESDNLPQAHRSRNGGTNILELSAHDVNPLVPPNGAPVRFRIGRIAEVTDFASWTELADLFLPLYRDASAIPASGPLRDEVEKIRSSGGDPKHRAELALALVQDRVRYVALEMGQGGLVPAAAETTWSRRFGDCKGKTALLLGILHSLGIDAEPVLVQSSLGDMIAGQLPMISLFDHVLVRAHIGGKDYWLDGTRTGDTNLDSIKVPDFGWGLPLVQDAQLVRIIPAPLDTPDTETLLQVDATGGVYATAPATAEETLRGDLAVATQAQLSSLTDSQLQEFFRKFWTNEFDFLTFKTGAFTFDKAKGELHLTMAGDANLDWSGGYFHVPQSTVGYHPELDRAPGPLQQSPFAVDYPSYNKIIVRLRMPQSFVEGRKLGSANVHETIAGIEYNRSTVVDGDTITVENSAKSLVPEITYKDAISAEPRLIALSNEDVALPVPESYQMTEADLAALHKQEPTTAADLVTRGNNFMNAKHFDDAIADFTKALSIDPKDVVALADRAIGYIWKRDYKKAEDDLAAAEAKDPNNAVVLRARGLAAELKGDVAAEIQFYTRSLEIEPGNPFALDHRGAAYYRDWQQDKAINDLTQVLKRYPKDVMALSYRALAEIQKGDYRAANADAASAKMISPNSPTVHLLEADLAKHRGDSSAEIASYSSLIQTSPDKADAYAQLANAYLRLHRYNDVLAKSEEAFKLGYKNTDLHVARANAFMYLGKRDAVAGEAEAMTKESPNSSYAFVAAAKTYAALGEKDKAMRAFDRALAIKPDAIVYVNRAVVRPFTDLDGRIADLDAALKLEPNNVDVLSTKAWQLILKGDYQGALALYDHATQLEPGDSGAALGRALALYRSGRQGEAKQLLADRRSKAITADDFGSICWTEAGGDMFLQQALSDCDRAHQLDPKSGFNGTAVTLLRLGRFHDAILEFDKSIAANPTAFAYMGRAIAYSHEGDSLHAEADRAEALKLDPDEEVNIAEYGLKFDMAAAKKMPTMSQQTPAAKP